MIISAKCFFVNCINLILITAFSTFVEQTTTLSSAHTSGTQLPPFRYQRLVLFFFSKDVTIDFYKSTMTKLFELDHYCGGENLASKIFLNGSFFFSWIKFPCAMSICPLKEAFSDFLGCVESIYRFNASIAWNWNVSSGNVDERDIKNVSATLFEALNKVDWEAGKQNIDILSQVILLTDYATLSITANNIVWKRFKSQKNLTFIALISNLTNVDSYFPNDVWTTAADYLDWTPDKENPICANNKTSYPTLSSSFGSFPFLQFNIYPLFSSDNINKKTQLVGVAELLDHLRSRRWLNQCRQYRYILFGIKVIDLNLGKYCVAETQTNPDFVNLNDIPWCSKSLFSQWLHQINEPNGDISSSSCGDYYNTFTRELANDVASARSLLITDLPLPCTSNTNYIYNLLKNYTDYKNGALLTVIAIDKINDSTVFDSYKPLFPRTQLPNLYQVYNINDILPNVSSSRVINFCRDSVPVLTLGKQWKTFLPTYDKVVWYFYVIGAVLLISIATVSAIIFLKRKRKRDAALRQMRKLEPNRRTMAANRNQYELGSNSRAIDDIWKVSIESLDIDYKNSIGRGAFSVVYSGFLRGKAPVLAVFPFIALQHFADCDVAIKTVPQYSDESSKTKFRSEIELMKEIGYHTHLVGMLGHNCSVERPILLMELAEQDLLHWLTSRRSSTKTNETTPQKTLLSISWQIADGMSYLSSKHFIHRDLAARNVLLNVGMKAMISDFGLCQKCDDHEQGMVIPGGRLPLKWMALESLQERRFSLKTDVWSFGVLLFEIFSLGLEPYMDTPSQKLAAFLLEGKRLSKPEQASDHIYDLMLQCWNAKPLLRPCFSSIQSYFALMLEDSTANYGYLLTTQKEPADA